MMGQRGFISEYAIKEIRKIPDLKISWGNEDGTFITIIHTKDNERYLKYKA